MITVAVIVCLTVLGCYAMSLYAAFEQRRALVIANDLSEHLRDECKDLVAAAEKHEELTKKVLLEHNERLMSLEYWKSKQAIR